MSEFPLLRIADLAKLEPRNTWVIRDHEDDENPAGLECLKPFWYWMPAEMLLTDAILLHMAEKDWIAWEEFLPAFYHARYHFYPHLFPSVQQIYAAKKRPWMPQGIRFDILRRDQYRCQICGRTAADGVKLEVDHRVARANGGSDSAENLWTLCFDCNRGKSTKQL